VGSGSNQALKPIAENLKINDLILLFLNKSKITIEVYKGKRFLEGMKDDLLVRGTLGKFPKPKKQKKIPNKSQSTIAKIATGFLKIGT